MAAAAHHTAAPDIFLVVGIDLAAAGTALIDVGMDLAAGMNPAAAGMDPAAAVGMAPAVGMALIVARIVVAGNLVALDLRTSDLGQ